jgi:hypothetical protein
VEISRPFALASTTTSVKAMPKPEKSERKKAIQAAQRAAAKAEAAGAPRRSAIDGDENVVCYLDDSGTSTEPVLSMSGYFAPAGIWSEFETRAKKIFDQFGISELHAKEFHDTKDEFKGWSLQRKKAFVAHLYTQLAQLSVLGVDSGITRTAYERARFELEHNPNESRYGNCFRWIVETIMQSVPMRAQASVHRATLSFIVEAGNKNDADISRIFDEMKYNPNHVGVVDVMKSVSFANKGSTYALQMADFLAFHSRRYKSRCEVAREYLPMSDMEKMIFFGVMTKTNLHHDYKTNEEIAAGYVSPNSWRLPEGSQQKGVW